MRTVMKIIGSVFNVLLTGVIILMAVLIGITIFSEKSDKDILGIKTYIVKSESMSPTFGAGSLVFAKPITFDEVNAAPGTGDIVTFESASTSEMVTHRAIRFETGEDGQKYLITKGDNPENAEDKPPLDADRLKERVFFWIPQVGIFVAQMQNRYFFLVSCLLMAFLIIMPYLLEEKV